MPTPPYKYRFTTISFADGTTVTPGDVTVLIGPNNAGKSRALKDLVRLASRGNPSGKAALRSLEWSMPKSLADLTASYNIRAVQDEGGNWKIPHLLPDFTTSEPHHGGIWPKWHEELINYANASAAGPEGKWAFAEAFGRSLIALLTTERRLQIAHRAPSHSDDWNTTNMLQAFFKAGRVVEANVRRIIKEAFGCEIALDYTSLQQLGIRIAANFDDLPSDPRDALPVMARASKLDDEGDGIRSFVGIVIAVLSTQRDVVLIDEPEAFLHPPQAFRIGQFLADQGASGKQLVVATHSADVLRGILSKRRAPSVVRFDRSGSKFETKVVVQELLQELVDDPLLSSARVIDGLFYSGAVVVEADSDARFYQTVGAKLRPNLDLHFVNADNKQTVPKVIQLYRRAGVKCAGIVDVDALNDKVELRRQLESFGVEDIEGCLSLHTQIALALGDEPVRDRLKGISVHLRELSSGAEAALGADDKAVASAMRDIESRLRLVLNSGKGWKRLKAEGIDALPPDARTPAAELIGRAAAMGLMINPQGELETMLVAYGLSYTTDKRVWIQSALRMLAGLQVDVQQQPWKLMRAVCDYLIPAAT